MTGRCGTRLGYRDHVVDRTPKCGPCRRAHADQRAAQRRVAYLAGPQMVDTAGTVRRLQALSAIGWPLREVGERLGVTPQTLRRLMRQARCSTATRDKVAALYDELSMIVGGNARTVTWARKRGFAPPLAWDDDTIDNPAAQPVTAAARDPRAFDEVAVDRAVAGDAVPLRPVERAEVVHRLTVAGFSAAAIAVPLGIEERSVQRIRGGRRKTNHLGETA